MTDKEKLEAIKAEIKRLNSLIIDRCYLSEYERGCNDGKENTLDDLLRFIDSLPEEPISEELEEAANNFLTGFYGVGEPHNPTDIGIFEAGAQWDRQLLMKDAIDTIMVYDVLNDLIPGIEDLSTNGYTVGDKVKVIIIKDE